MIRISPSAKVMLPHQSTRARLGVLRSSSFRYAHTVPNSPTGTEIRNTRRQSIGASRPPSTRPMNIPLTPTMLLMPERHPALVGREGVGEDRRRVGQQEGRADPLDDPEHDQVVAPGAPGHPVDGQQQRGDRVDDEAEVVHPHPAVHVAEAPEADDQHARDDQVAEDHPQQVEAVGRHQRIEVDAAEDVGHRDQRDRRVERRQQHPERRVRQRDPLVAVRAGGPPFVPSVTAGAAATLARMIRASPPCLHYTGKLRSLPVFSAIVSVRGVSADVHSSPANCAWCSAS